MIEYQVLWSQGAADINEQIKAHAETGFRLTGPVQMANLPDEDTEFCATMVREDAAHSSPSE